MNKQQKLDIVELYKVMPTSEIAERYGVTTECIRWNLKNSGVRLLPKGNRLRLPLDEIKQEYEGGMNGREIALRHGYTTQQVDKLLLKNGVTKRPSYLNKRTTTVNDACFSEITEESAYWAGFLMADGTVFIKGESHKVVLGLSSADIGHLNKFRDFIGSSRKIIEYSFINRDGNKQSVCSIAISSHQIVEDLGRFGVIPHKTSRECVSESLKYNRHFWRGMMDGDGHMSLSTKKPFALLQLCGSEIIMSQFCEFVKTISPKSYMKPHKAKHANIYKCCTTGHKRVASTIKALYSDCSIYLDRKKEIADRIITSELPLDRIRK